MRAQSRERARMPVIIISTLNRHDVAALIFVSGWWHWQRFIVVRIVLGRYIMSTTTPFIAGRIDVYYECIDCVAIVVVTVWLIRNLVNRVGAYVRKVD